MISLVENESLDPAYNLALEQYLFQKLNSKQKVLMLWQNAPSVIVGRYQNTIEEVNVNYAQNKGITIIRRITGGGAVYHDLGNLNYTLIAPNDGKSIDLVSFNSLLINALKNIGIPAKLTGRNDITIEGLKISGSAQRRSNQSILHHGTLLFDVDLEEMQKVLSIQAGEIHSKGHKSVKSRVTNISSYLKDPMDIVEFKERILFELTQHNQPQYISLTKEEVLIIQEIKEHRYNTWDWNFGKSPDCNLRKELKYNGGKVTIHLNIKHGKIEDCYIKGDFFGNRESSELEDELIGLPYQKKAIKTLISSIPINEYIAGITTSQLLKLIIE